MGNDASKHFWNLFDHLFPFIFLSVDWFFNKIYFEANQVYFNLFVFFVYGMCNLTISEVRGKPVYPPMSWDSVVAWAFALAMIPLALGFWVGLYYLTKCKFRCLKLVDVDQRTVVDGSADESYDYDQEISQIPSSVKGNSINREDG